MWKRLYEKTMNQLVDTTFSFKMNSLTGKKEEASVVEKISKPEEKPVMPPVKKEKKKNVVPGKNKVNVNTATMEEISEKTGLGIVTAKHIVRYRKMNGPFKRVEDLMKVSRFGSSCMKKYGGMFEV
jgi:competence ComEA-like helix-hairpin-helix protein